MRRLITAILAAISLWAAVAQDWLAMQFHALLDDDQKDVWFHDPPAPRWIVAVNWTMLAVFLVLLALTVGAQIYHAFNR